MKKVKEWILPIFSFYFLEWFPYIVVFSTALYNPSDSDLGWHLKYGEYFFRFGKVLRENIFSADMAGFRWVNSSWLTDLVTYITFAHFGFFGLTVLAGLVVTATFYFLAKTAKLSFWDQSLLFPIISYLIEPLTLVSFRGHLLSLLGIAILYFLIKEFENGKKAVIFWVLPLFILWSNLHGEFILGWGIFTGWILLYLFRVKFKLINLPNKSPVKLLLTLIPLSWLATIINPFGLQIYFESFNHFGNPLQKYIVEWLPFTPNTLLWWNLVAWGVVIGVALVIIIIKKQFLSELFFIITLLLLYFLSFWMRRYNWPMYLLSIPIAKYALDVLRPKKKFLRIGISSFILISFYFFIIYIKNPAQRFSTMNWDRYCREYVGCSTTSAEFIKQNKPKGNLLSFYNWGGWIIWNYYPEIVPSIDGRMHLWKDKNGKSAFTDYYSLEQGFDDVNKSKYDTVWMTPTKPIFTKLMALVNQGKWKILYEDSFAVIFERKEINRSL